MLFLSFNEHSGGSGKRYHVIKVQFGAPSLKGGENTLELTRKLELFALKHHIGFRFAMNMLLLSSRMST